MSPSDNRWVLVDPKEPLPCSLGVVARPRRLADLARVEGERRTRRYRVRAILSDHIPVSGSMSDVLERPSHTLTEVDGGVLSIYLHHGGRNVVYFDLVGEQPTGTLRYVEVVVNSAFPSNCFWAARTAVSQLLDSMMRTAWLPLVVRRLDLYVDDEDEPLCHQLILPFTEGVRWGPLGGIHQFPPFAPYEALVREAITTGSPYYRLLCAYRLYEGIQPLRKLIRDLAARFSISVQLPKPPPVDLEWLRAFGIHDQFLSGLKNVEDFWQRTADMRNAAAHFLLEDTKVPISLSHGPTYQQYSIAGALLLHYSHRAFQELSSSMPNELADRMLRGSIGPDVSRKEQFSLDPDKM